MNDNNVHGIEISSHASVSADEARAYLKELFLGNWFLFLVELSVIETDEELPWRNYRRPFRAMIPG